VFRPFEADDHESDEHDERRADPHDLTGDVLVGEDGTVEFQPDMAYYDSVKMEVGEAPLTNIQVRAQVQWTQRPNGYVKGSPVNVSTFTGGSFIGEWPKPGASLGSGWSVAFSFCWDAVLRSTLYNLADGRDSSQTVVIPAMRV